MKSRLCHTGDHYLPTGSPFNRSGLRRVITLGPGCTTRGPSASSRPGSRLMQRASTTLSGFADRETLCAPTAGRSMAGPGGTPTCTTPVKWRAHSLDIEWAHALAPAANILLVEAAYNYTPILLEAEQYAAENAKYVSNSWGSWEFDGESSLDSFLTQPGVSYFAAAGDSGGLVEWPSSSPDVISVGGTSLTFTSGGQLAQEAAWSHGGGGCSSYETAST